MTNEVTMQARAYSVTVEDQRSGEKSVELIALDKQQLQAAQIVGQSSNELIYRLFNRQGYKVLDIGKPVKKEIVVDLTELYREAVSD
ncbi:MAG: hypothetical protein HFE98_01670 [Ruminiclostridium sp.]|jgi:hypothetical protein|nr:hypothetical protein [Ruminiclostridium sp.]